MVHEKDLQTSKLVNATTWDADPVHSAVTFSVRHMMFAKVRGRFKSFQAVLHLDERDPTASVVEAEIEADSIDTDAADRDEHLRSADFFNVLVHPKITFRSTQVTLAGQDRAQVQGELTIRGVTREVGLDVVREGSGKDPWGNDRAAYTATGTIDRKEFGLEWNQVLETGGVLVGDKVKMQIEVQLVKRRQRE